MSVRGLLSAIFLGLSSLAVVADEEAPEIEFLEYLGMWEGSDEDWVMFSGSAKAENLEQERSEPAPESEDSTEKSDES